MPTTVKRLALKARLVLLNLSIAEVARRCGVSRGHLSRVIHGRAELDDKLARDISLATRIPKATVASLDGHSE